MTHSASGATTTTPTRRLLVQPQQQQRAALSVSGLGRHVGSRSDHAARTDAPTTVGMQRLARLLALLVIGALAMMATGALPLPLAAAAAAPAHDQPVAAAAAAAAVPTLSSNDAVIQQLESLPVPIPPDAHDGHATAPPSAAAEAPLPAPAAAAAPPADPPAPLPSQPEEQLNTPTTNDEVAPPPSTTSPATATVDEAAAVDAIAVADSSAAAPPVTEPDGTQADAADSTTAPPDEPNSPVADSTPQDDSAANSAGEAPAAVPATAEPIDAAASAPSLSNGTVVVVELNGSTASTSESSVSTGTNGSVLVPIPAALSRLVNESSALNATVLAAVLANVSTAAVPVIVVAVPTPAVSTPLVATTSSGSSGGESKEDIPRLDAYKQTVLDMVAEKKGKKIKKKEEEDAAAAVAAAAVGGATNGGSATAPPAPPSTDSAPSTPDAAHAPSQSPPQQSSAPPDQVQLEPSHSAETIPEVSPPVADVAAPASPPHSATIPRPPESDESEHDRDRFNYAAFDAGAKMLATSPGMKKASAILVADDDRYLMVPCNAPQKSFVIQLSEDIIIDTIELANLEHYASSIRDFQILGSATHPTQNWVLLGSFTALDSAQKQVFTLPSREWVRFIKLRWTSHYGEEYYCTLTYLRVYGTTMLETFREEMQQSEVDVKEITREINNIKPLANKEDAAAAANGNGNGNGNAHVLGVPALPTPTSGSTGASASTGSTAPAAETKEGATTSPPAEPHPEENPVRSADPARTDGVHSAKPASPHTDSAPSAQHTTPSTTDASCAVPTESTSPPSDGSASTTPAVSTVNSSPAAPASPSSPGESPVTSSSQEDRAKFEAELAKFTGRPQPIGGSGGANATNSSSSAADATALAIPSAFVNKSLLAVLLHEVATVDTIADVLVAADPGHHPDTSAPSQHQPQSTDSPVAPPPPEGTSTTPPAETNDAETSAAAQQAGTAPSNGDAPSIGSVPAAPALPSDAAVPIPDRAAAPVPVVSKEDILPLPPLLKSSLGSSGSGGSSSGAGGGQQSIFKALTNRIKELEIHQALASNYVSDLADRYVKDTAALRARLDAMAHEMAAHASRNEAQWSEGWSMMNRTAAYVQADSHRVMAAVKEQLEEAQEFLALVESIIYLQLAVAICTALAYFLGRWVLSIVVGLQRLLCCMCVRRKRIARHTYSKSSPNLMLTAQQLQELRDERQELEGLQPATATRRASPKLHLRPLPLSPKRSPMQHTSEHHERGTRVRAASIAVVQQHHQQQQSSRLASGSRHVHSASAYSPRHMAGLNPRRASAAAGVSFDSIPQFDREAAYLWAERNGPHVHSHAHDSREVLRDEIVADDDDTDTQKNSSVEVSEDDRDNENDNENENEIESEGEAEYERADSNEQRYLAHLIQQQQAAFLQQQAKAARRRQMRRMSAVDRSASSSPAAASPVRQHVRAATVDLAPSASARTSRAGSFLSMLKSSLSPRTSMTQSAPPPLQPLPSGLPAAAAVSAPTTHRLHSATVAFSSDPAAATAGVAVNRRAQTVPAPLLRSLLGGIVHGSMNLLSGRNRSHPHSAVADVAEEAESLNGVAGQSESAPPLQLSPLHPSSPSPSSILRASPLQPLEPQDDDIAEEDPSAALADALPPATHATEAHFPADHVHAESFGAVPLPSSARSFNGSSSAASVAAAAMHFSSPRRALRSPNQFDLLASPAVPTPVKAHEGSSPTSGALTGAGIFGDKRGQAHSHGQRVKQR